VLVVGAIAAACATGVGAVLGATGVMAGGAVGGMTTILSTIGGWFTSFAGLFGITGSTALTVGTGAAIAAGGAAAAVGGADLARRIVAPNAAEKVADRKDEE